MPGTILHGYDGVPPLELCARTIGAGPGAEIIVPSYTFVSTANAFVTCGATPVLVDVRADTQNLDETKVEAAITDRTIAIFSLCLARRGRCSQNWIPGVAVGISPNLLL